VHALTAELLPDLCLERNMTAPSVLPIARTGISPGTPRRDGARTTAATPHVGQALAVLRIATGWLFLWPFLDKLFGLGYSTTSAKAWIHGGSPTRGFLANVHVGPLQGFFHAMAGNVWADWGFMLALLGIGVALLLGVGLRVVAAGGTLLVLGMWLASWPSTRFVGGKATASTNPFLDDHLLYALMFVVFAAGSAGDTWGLGKQWAALPIVRRVPWLR
jgi:thiosulfate dehydrogenase [quinone] large subunit